MTFPRFNEIEVPLLRVLIDLGGSAAPKLIYPKVAAHFPNLTPEEQEQRLENYPSTRKWSNLVQWSRQRLVDAGDVDGSKRGVWAITPKGRARAEGGAQIVQTGASVSAEPAPQADLRDLANMARDEAKSRLLTELKSLSPTGFERFCSQFLEHLGFTDLSVTKRAGDGGIDGHGNFRQGAVSIKSAFQAKRWADNPVGRPEIDNLRGAIQGDYDHGVFLTTSRFTKGATEASYKKGAITILMLDGEAIAEIMLDRGIGVNKVPIVTYEIDDDFFDFDDA